MGEQFSVRLYYDNGEQKTLRRFVSAQEAYRAFQYYTKSLGARLGSTVRVIIIDGDDCMVREWKVEQGVTFPPPKRRRKSGGKKFSPSDDARS
jgi:hypothetical protein